MAYKTTAIYENGGLRPLEPLKGIAEHSVVQITVEPLAPPNREEQLALLRTVAVAEELASAIETGRTEVWPIDEF